MDRKLNLTSSIPQKLSDRRDKKKISHDQVSLLRQHVYVILSKNSFNKATEPLYYFLEGMDTRA